MVDIEMHLQKGFYTVARGEMKGKRNEASQPRLDIIFSTSYAFSKNIFIDIGLDPDMYKDTCTNVLTINSIYTNLMPEATFRNALPTV